MPFHALDFTESCRSAGAPAKSRCCEASARRFGAKRVRKRCFVTHALRFSQKGSKKGVPKTQQHIRPCPRLATSFSSSFANASAGGKAARRTDPRPSPLLTNPSSSEGTPTPLNEPSSRRRRAGGVCVCANRTPFCTNTPPRRKVSEETAAGMQRGPRPRRRQLKGDAEKPREMPKKTPGNAPKKPGNAQETPGDAKEKVNKHLQVHKSHPGRMGLPYRAI